MRALLNAAHDGDTITLPAGRFSWTSCLEITKGITLKGQTTITGAGTSNPAITDETILKDDTPRSGINTGMIIVNMMPSQSFRLTGITFAPGSSTIFASGPGLIRLGHLGYAAPNTSMRVDHCHFTAPIYQPVLLTVGGWIYGVADHNVMEVTGNMQPFFVSHAAWNNKLFGNGSWADYPWYGTEKFFFIEDNTVRRTGIMVRTLVDSIAGGRWVARHNYLLNVIPSGHGTEAGAPRGQRANEFYDNTINAQIPWGGGVQRSGTSLWHDNTYIGLESNGDIHTHLDNYRETAARPDPVWGIADGTSPWDMNDTEGNGTYVEGHPPFLFASGSATSGTTVSGEQATFSDSTKNWTPNQWIGYSVRNTDRASGSYGRGSYIISNGAHSITYAYTLVSPGIGQLNFNAGDTYEIHRVLVMMDQNGRGKGDQITGRPQPINTTTGTAKWNHGALEPCYSWNNIYTPNGHALEYGVRRGQPTTKLNVDFFNLGGGFPADTTPSAVSSTYTAALNGVDYVGTFVYPHPLVSGIQRPPSATRGPSNTFRKKGKKLKGKGEQKNRR